MGTIYYKIGGANVSQEVRSQSLMSYDNLSQNPNSASFTLDAPDSEPTEGSTVSIYYDNTSQMIFGGTITAISRINIASSKYAYTLSCSDHRRFFDRQLVKTTFASGVTLDSVVSDIVAIYTTDGFTINNVDAPATTVNDYVFNYRYPSDCLREIAAATGHDWYIDADKDVHFFYGREKTTAPFTINDAALETYGIFGFSISCEYSQIRNVIYVQGGYELSGNTRNEERIADGNQRIWNLPYKPQNLVVKVGGVTQTLGQENVDTDDGTYEYMYNVYDH